MPLTLLGRCGLLLAGELAATLALWTTALALFLPDPGRRGVLGIALVAWTLGLRHGLDMDHIVAIDNVTRNLVRLGQLPVTCGLFFSLGHSTIVVATTIAIIISTDSITHLPGVASVGGTIGVSVSASFLILLAIINGFALFFSIRERKKSQLRASIGEDEKEEKEKEDVEKVLPPEDQKDTPEEHKSPSSASSVTGLRPTTCIARVTKPILRTIDQPWKMYPVGVLFGLGFDTSSEIALLGISAVARSGSSAIPTAQIILLPLLFTAGMSLVDSLDSIFMLHAYSLSTASRKGASRWKLFERAKKLEDGDGGTRQDDQEVAAKLPSMPDSEKLFTLSVLLTVISISVALLIALIEFMGLAAQLCDSCAASAENDPGLAGKWWRFWSKVNDNSGFLGAGVVGIFVLVLGGWGIVRWYSSRGKKRAQEGEGAELATVACL